MTSSLLPETVPLRGEVEVAALRIAEDGPLPGDVVVHEGRSVVAVAASAIEGTGLWAAGGEHVLGVIEVVLRRAGVSVLLPLCRSPLDDVLRRADATDGALVTAAVSMLRGAAAELRHHPRGQCTGQWWVDESGAPLFVHLDGGRDAPASARDILEALTPSSPAVADAVSLAAAALSDPDRLGRSGAAAEEALFRAAAPAALPTSPAPSAARRVAASERRRPVVSAGTSGWHRVASALDGSWADTVSELLDAMRRRLRPRVDRPRRRRRGLVLVVAAVGALACAVGLLWPAETPETDRAAADPVAVTPTPPAGDAPEGAEATEPVAIAASVLAAWRACVDDECRARHQEPAFAAAAPGAALSAAPQLTLLDDLGGLLLVRAEDPADGAASQIVAFVLRNDEWVLRGIHDAAQHP